MLVCLIFEKYASAENTEIRKSCQQKEDNGLQTVKRRFPGNPASE